MNLVNQSVGRPVGQSVGQAVVRVVLGLALCMTTSTVVFGQSANGLRPTHPHQPPAQNGESGAINNLDTCFSPDEGCDQKLIGFINTARSTLDVAIYSITHDGIGTAITSARSRGVTVRIVADRKEAKGKGSLVESLRANGVELKLGNQHGIMHNKFTIVDGEMIETGSFNYSQNATSENAENQIYLNDGNVIQRYQTEFEKLWANGISQ